jgi:hypothetical protein
MTVKVTQPEILPPGRPSDGVHPRMGGAGGAFRDENLDMLSRVLDTWFRVPGTSIRFGLGVSDLFRAWAICWVGWLAASSCWRHIFAALR